MANKFSQLTTTPFVQTYAPAPVGQMGQLAKEAFAMKSSIADTDAKTEALFNSIGANDPEAREFLNQNLSKYQQEALGDEGESLSDRAIRSRTAGTKAAGVIQNFQNAQQKIKDWEEKSRELSEGADQKDLNYILDRTRPKLQYSDDYSSVSVDDASPIAWAPKSDLGKVVDETLKGTKEDILRDDEGNLLVHRGVDPISGKVEIVTQKGVSKDRVKDIVDYRLAVNPEVQTHLQQTKELYSLKAKEQGATEMLEGIKNNAPEGALEDLTSQIKTLRENDYEDHEIVGHLMATNELRNAQGFGQSKYAYTDIGRDHVSYSDSKKQEALDGIEGDYELARAVNNPFLRDIPSNINLSSELGDSESLNIITDPRDRLFMDEETRGVLKEGQTSYHRKLDSKDINEVLNSDKIKELYGTTLADLSKEFPKDEEGETNSEYIERLQPKYKELMEKMGSLYQPRIPLKGADAVEATNEIIGTRGVDGMWGSIVNSLIVDSEGKAMTFEQFTEKYDIDPADYEDFRKKALVSGRYKGTDATSPSGYYMNLPTKGGWFSKDSVQEFKIIDRGVVNERYLEPLMAIEELKQNPTKNSKTINIGDKEFDFISENRYIEDENGQKRFSNRVLGVKHGDKVYYEGDEIYEDFIQGLKNR